MSRTPRMTSGTPRRFLALLAAALGALWAVPLLAQKPAQAKAPGKHQASAIQVLKVESDEVKLPPEFQMALYENLIEEIRKTRKFERIFRDGEQGAAEVPDLVTLRSNVRGFKEGSARARQVTTVAGATSLTIHVQISDRSGRMVIDRDVRGRVRFFGENLRATSNFSRAVAKLIQQTF